VKAKRARSKGIGSVIHQTYLILVLFMDKSPIELLTDALFIGVIIALIVINLKTLLLPNKITYPSLALAMIVRLLLPNLSSFGLLEQAPFSKLPPSLVSIDGAIIGAVIGGGTLLLVGWGWQRLRGVEALGLGDVKMMCMIGAYLGIAKTVLTLLLVVFLMVPVTVAVAAIFIKVRNQMVLPSGFLWGVPAIVVTLFGEIILKRAF
jgi:leader peptidase (prepilin peptidase) / N-methyltransferase